MVAYRDSNAITPESAKQGGTRGVNQLNGVYVGIVDSNDDAIYTGRIKVKLPEFGSATAPYICLLITNDLKSWICGSL